AEGFGRELFMWRPLRRFVERYDSGVVALPSSLPVTRAVARALARPVQHLFDPVLTVSAEKGVCLLDLRVVLIEQSRWLERMSEEVERQRARAEEASRAKTDFLANMS
ncbi:MAG TPA: hypothetical protein DEB06_04090, partial [Phycisphaerales bacterium]|nr:hypothetical protein [Phycisphaerales bacterium]